MGDGQIFQEVGKDSKVTETEEDRLNRIIKTYDTDGDGLINKDEMFSMILDFFKN